MRDVFENGDHDYWTAGLHAKFGGEGAVYGRGEFDLVLGKYEVYS